MKNLREIFLTRKKKNIDLRNDIDAHFLSKKEFNEKLQKKVTGMITYFETVLNDVSRSSFLSDSDSSTVKLSTFYKEKTRDSLGGAMLSWCKANDQEVQSLSITFSNLCVYERKSSLEILITRKGNNQLTRTKAVRKKVDMFDDRSIASFLNDVSIRLSNCIKEELDFATSGYVERSEYDQIDLYSTQAESIMRTTILSALSQLSLKQTGFIPSSCIVIDRQQTEQVEGNTFSWILKWEEQNADSPAQFLVLFWERGTSAVYWKRLADGGPFIFLRYQGLLNFKHDIVNPQMRSVLVSSLVKNIVNREKKFQENS